MFLDDPSILQSILLALISAPTLPLALWSSLFLSLSAMIHPLAQQKWP